MNSHKKVKLTMVVKAENIVADMNRVIRNVIGKGRANLATADLNLLNQTIWRNNREPAPQKCNISNWHSISYAK